MKFKCTQDVRSSKAAVLKRLQAVEVWGPALSGTVTRSGQMIRFEFEIPRPFSVTISLQKTAAGFDYQLVEGDLSQTEGSVVVSKSGKKTAVVWQHEMAAPTPIPPSLWLEFGEVVMGRWLSTILGQGL